MGSLTFLIICTHSYRTTTQGIAVVGELWRNEGPSPVWVNVLAVPGTLPGRLSAAGVDRAEAAWRDERR